MTARRARGFTLLELMIGLGLLGLIMILIFAGMQLTFRGWDTAEAASEKANRMRLVQALLARELAAVFPYRWKTSVDMKLAFVGAADSLRFVSSTPPRAGQRGLNLVELFLDRSGRDVRLLMRRQIPAREQRDFEPLEHEDSVVLLDHLEGAAFEFFGSDTPAGKSSWRDRWEDPQRLPRLVRVSLRSQGSPPWPDVVVALQVNERAGCSGWDEVNERCHRQAAP
jgi:general secretion pathway protein J